MASNPIPGGQLPPISASDLARTCPCPWRTDVRNLEKRGSEVLRSVRIRNEPRFKEIEHYTRSSDHFQHLIDRSGSETTTKRRSSLTTIKIEQIDSPEANGLSKEVKERAEWQMAFDRSVKRLLIDFDLSDEPTLRLGHLDRMHSWFVTHGQKQRRKAKPPPNFLVIEKNGVVPGGSTQHISGKLSATALTLAGSMAMRRSRNLPSLPEEAPNAYNTVMPHTAR